MEEIDNIIIHALRHLNCDIPEEVNSLKQFDVDMVVVAISTCLESIIPSSTFSKKLPPTMTLRLKLASHLSQQITDLGFQEDIGYQTILYYNEVEVRRLLMFLIERLPRETGTGSQTEERGYVPRLINEIENRIRSALDSLWLPTTVLDRGARITNTGFDMNSSGNSSPLQSVILKIPQSSVKDEGIKHFNIHVVPEVTKQCHPHQLIPSLLFKDNEFNSECDNLESYMKNVSILPKDNVYINEELSTKEYISEQNIVNNNENSNHYESTEDEIKCLLKELETEKARYLQLLEEIKVADENLTDLKSAKDKEEEMFKTTVSKLKIKTKTLAVISNEENLSKLKKLVKTGNERLVDLANQWNQVQTPLLEEYKSLQTNISADELRLQKEQNKLTNVKDLGNNLYKDLKEKEALEQILIKRCQQLNKTNNRSSYTRRIMEIIGNVKKQNLEIQNVLKDTREVQKDISNLTGQVDRSFTISDELIFQNAKHDETSRRAYKLLACLRDDCTDIIRMVTDLGAAERESRNLQEQLDVESAKETIVKLTRVNKDLEQIRLETANLTKQT